MQPRQAGKPTLTTIMRFLALLVLSTTLGVDAMPPRVRNRDDADVGDHPTVVRPRRHAVLNTNVEPPAFNAGADRFLMDEAAETHEALHAEAVGTDGHFTTDAVETGGNLEQRDTEVAAAAAFADGIGADGQRIPHLVAEDEVMRDAPTAAGRGGGHARGEAGPSGTNPNARGKGGKGGPRAGKGTGADGGKGAGGKGGKGHGGGGRGGHGYDPHGGMGADGDPEEVQGGGGHAKGGGRGKGKGKGRGKGKGKGGKGKGGRGWQPQPFSAVAGQRLRWVGGVRQKVIYLKVCFHQDENTLVRASLSNHPLPLCSPLHFWFPSHCPLGPTPHAPARTIPRQLKRGAGEILHDVKVSQWLGDGYEVTLGSDGVWTRELVLFFLTSLMDYLPITAASWDVDQADLSLFDGPNAPARPTGQILKTTSLSVRAAASARSLPQQPLTTILPLPYANICMLLPTSLLVDRAPSLARRISMASSMAVQLLSGWTRRMIARHTSSRTSSATATAWNAATGSTLQMCAAREGWTHPHPPGCPSARAQCCSVARAPWQGWYETWMGWENTVSTPEWPLDVMADHLAEFLRDTCGWIITIEDWTSDEGEEGDDGGDDDDPHV